MTKPPLDVLLVTKPLGPPWNDGTLSLTVSIGVAEWTQHMKSDDLIAEADQALYQAKHLGRDLVVTQPSVETVTAD